ncbi:MAG TPA: hypothetical protein VFM46_18555, partial [Pseudomonadales bacterium]|nr:hypothetical protein [Pseudomonadales bacterium]
MTSPSLLHPRRIPEASVLEFALRDIKMLTDPLKATSRLYDLYGPIMMHKIGTWKTVNLFGPDANAL